MLNKINFTGRETMLTKGVKEVAAKANEYVGAGKVYADNKIATAPRQGYVSASKIFDYDDKYRIPTQFEESANISKAEDLYTSPFSPIKNSVAKDKKVQEETNGYLYNVAHGKPDYVAEENVSDSQALLNLLA